MSDKIKCPSCGKKIKATAKFCGFCATKIESEPIEKRGESIGESSSAYVNPLEGINTTGGTRGGTNPTTVSGNVEINSESEKNVEIPAGKVCTVCGKKMAARAKFCGACGGTLVEDEKKNMTVDVETSKEEESFSTMSSESNADETDIGFKGMSTSPVSNNMHSDFKTLGDL